LVLKICAAFYYNHMNKLQQPIPLLYKKNPTVPQLLHCKSLTLSLIKTSSFGFSQIPLIPLSFPSSFSFLNSPSFPSHSVSLIPLSFTSHSGFSQILLIPPSFPSFDFPSFSCHSPHSVSPHFPYHSPVHSVSPHFPSFPSHSTVIWFPLIRFLKFPCHSPHSPGFPLIRFPLLHTQFSLGYSLMAVLSRLSFSSPVLSRFSLAIPLFSEEAGQHHRFKGQGAGGLDLKDLLLIPSSHPSLPRQFPLLFVSLSLFWIR